MSWLLPRPASLKLTIRAPLASTLEAALMKWGLVGLIRWSSDSSVGRELVRRNNITGLLQRACADALPGTAQAVPHRARAAVPSCAVAFVSLGEENRPRRLTRCGWARELQIGRPHV